MYFSTLTEVPIVEGLLGAGMGKGPALAILLAGPALSLPNMLVIRTLLGTQKTLVLHAGCGHGHNQRLSLWPTDVRTTMKLTVYGSGCAKCQQLIANTEAAARRLGLEYQLEKVTDVNAIIDAGIMRTPALAVDDDILIEGKVPSSDELQQLLG